MKRLFEQILCRLKGGEDLVLVTIIAGSGSTPRGAGAKMAVMVDGSSFGTIGGGAVEFESQRIARQALEEKRSLVQGFTLAPNQVADLGMICGGEVTVHFQYLNARDGEVIPFFEEVLRLCGKDSNSWLLTRIAPDGRWQMCLMDREGRAVAATGGMQPDSENLRGLLHAKCVLHKEDDGTLLYAQPLVRAGVVYVFGGGHITQQLVPVLSQVFFSCTVIDSSPAFADPSLFPRAKEVMLADFGQVFGRLRVQPCDYIVIVTRGHQYDYEVLVGALATPACYIGMIGSRRKIAATYTRLIREDGFGYEDLQRVSAPIGLPIGGETPEEIAVSIAAQLIQVRFTRDGR